MARVKLVYPKMPRSKDCPSGRCIAFEKYDGTNLHWVWEQELGWYAFGTRRNRFDLDEQGIADFHSTHPGLLDAPELFQNEWAELLQEMFTTNPVYAAEEITVFTEYLGRESFAGKHKPDDPKQLVLIDVEMPEGFVPPETFVQDFGEWNIARVVYKGRLSGKLIHDVREGRYNVEEGVVCKGVENDQIWMVKIKTYEYLNRLKDAFAEDWEDFWE